MVLKLLFLAFFANAAYGFLPAAAIPIAAGSGPLAPFIVGGVAAFFTIKKLWSNPLGELKVELTHVYNDAADGLEENLARYLEEPASFQAQKERLAYFDNIWKYLHEISLKTAQGIISWNERQRNGKWPWEKYFRDPIANDPRLQGQHPTGGTFEPTQPVYVPETPTVDALPIDPITGIDSRVPQSIAVIAVVILLVVLLRQ